MMTRKLALMVCLGMSLASVPAAAQDASTAPKPEGSKTFTQEELEQMLAPIALYPDSLLSQILMACTYPLEIVQADRWAKANKELKGDALAKALEGQDWDASVRSLVNFPDVLASLSEKLEWTTKIGDAFLSDQKAVLDTVQKLRTKAKEAGNLESSDKVKVTTEAAPAGGDTQVIVIQSPSPEVIYVPTYDPVVVYGAWPYPAYPPPVYYRPPGYVAGAFVGFGLGLAWGYAWGDCDWHHGDVDIDIDRNFEFNRNIDRDRYKAEFTRRGGGEGGRGNWSHDASHRRGVEYRDSGAAQRFGGESRAQATQAREAYRGRADADRANLSRDAAAGRIDSGRIGADRPSTTDRAGGLDRGTSGRPNAQQRTGDRAGSPGASRSDYSRPSSSSRDRALGNSSYPGSSARRDSSRGSYSRSGGSFGGGGARGGGARGGGARGGGRR